MKGYKKDTEILLLIMYLNSEIVTLKVLDKNI